MLSFVQNMIGPAASPIGVDFGSETLRMIQVAMSGGEVRVIAAATADVPTPIRNDPAARLQFFTSSLKELIVSGGFKGRRAVLGLPASMLSMVHVRVPVLDDEALRKAIPFEVRGKLPYDPSHALIRHLKAGEIYQGQEPKLEAIVMASPKAQVEALLAAAGRAKVDVVGINTEPMALMDCFARVHRRKEDLEQTLCFVDIGASGTRIIIARGGQIMFARAINVGGDHFTRAVARASKTGFDDARLLRLRLADVAVLSPGASQGASLAPGPALPTVPQAGAAEEAPSEANSFALLGAGMARKEKQAAAGAELAAAMRGGGGGTATAEPEAPVEVARAAVEDAGTREQRAVETAVREPLMKLVEEMDLCRRYHEATFPSAPVERLVFVGGEAKQKGLCAFVARELGVAAQVGDPFTRVAKDREFPAESGLDRRGPQPGWAVALGLSMGAVTSQK